MPLPIADTRPLFRPLCGEIVDLLRTLGHEQWEQPTLTGTWRIRDLVAHLVDTALRRLSLHRDGSRRPAAGIFMATDLDLVAFINDLNATWVRAAQRLSPRVLTDLYAHASTELADFIETLPLDATAVLPVSWAGETHSVQWLDIGREFTEVWHHGSQIREATGAGPFPDSHWLHAVLQIALHAVPYAYRDVPGRPGLSVVLTITGRAPGTWALQHRDSGWEIAEGRGVNPAATATMSDEVAWRLLFNALTRADALRLIRLEGDRELALPLLRARAVVV